MPRWVLLVLLLAVGAVPAHADEASAVAAIEKLNGHVQRDEKLPGRPVRQVSLQATNATDADLAQLSQLKQLRILYLGYGTKITDAGLARVGALTWLEELYLPESSITDAGLAHLRTLKNLRKLGLNFCKGITDRGLAHLAGLTKLQSLSLDGTQATEAGVKQLQRALPKAYISGGVRTLPAGSPTRAERARKLKASEDRAVSAEMLDFMSFLDGTEAGSNEAVKKYVAAGNDSFDLSGMRLERPHVTKTERKDGQVCYTLQVRQGIGTGTYLLCWAGGKVRSVKQLSLTFD
ncbi:MAG TPA: hypothetical protein VFU47_08990 [Armatimonadota bacterium]|nr:hypothetical protein [Armatimonadota bacterium]